MNSIEKTLSIKPDAVEKFGREYKNFFIKNDLTIKKAKKFISLKTRQLNFIKFINLNLYNDYVIIFSGLLL